MRGIVVLPLVALALGCGHTAPLNRGAESGSHSDVAVDDVPVHGFDARVYLESGETLDGELLDVHKDWVALETSKADLRVSVAKIKEVRVTAYSNGPLVGGLIAWSTSGAATTLSHGWFLIFTAPTWIVAGVSSAVAAAEDPDQSALVRAGRQTDLWQFVRFPQGLPPGFVLEDYIGSP